MHDNMGDKLPTAQATQASVAGPVGTQDMATILSRLPNHGSEDDVTRVMDFYEAVERSYRASIQPTSPIVGSTSSTNQQRSDLATWGEVLAAINESAQQRGPLGPDLDGIRLGYIQDLQKITGRAVIIYASGWLTKSGFGDPTLTVEADDVHALMECCHGVKARKLDLIVHSPGGSPEAAEQMVNYLRTQFDHIRCFVPMQAKSAATMIALGCDEIVLGLHSESQNTGGCEWAA